MLHLMHAAPGSPFATSAVQHPCVVDQYSYGGDMPGGGGGMIVLDKRPDEADPRLRKSFVLSICLLATMLGLWGGSGLNLRKPSSQEAPLRTHSMVVARAKSRCIQSLQCSDWLDRMLPTSTRCLTGSESANPHRRSTCALTMGERPKLINS